MAVGFVGHFVGLCPEPTVTVEVCIGMVSVVHGNEGLLTLSAFLSMPRTGRHLTLGSRFVEEVSIGVLLLVLIWFLLHPEAI